MDDFFSQVWDDLIGRVFGPMKIRLVLQPLVAIILASRAAIKDAREGNPPYFWALFNNANDRRHLLQSGWKDVGRVFIFAILIDAVYQVIFLRWVYPGQLLIVAVVLAIVPYLLVRGPLNRVLRRRKSCLGRVTDPGSYRGEAPNNKMQTPSVLQPALPKKGKIISPAQRTR